jgi:tryptophan synthase alpha chain
MANRINTLFENTKSHILNIFFTAGFPNLNDTLPLLEAIQQAGANMAEIGIPYSDPIADGLTIQHSNDVALANGMTLKLLFEQLTDMRSTIEIPVLLMGYVNPVLQYGMERFCADCERVGIDGIILPDLPMIEYKRHYKAIFEKHNLRNVFLISPQTEAKRVHEIDAVSNSFIYMVAASSVTGTKSGISDEQLAYFERIRTMHLKNPTLIGFGISTAEQFQTACQYANGAIIGSAFIKALQGSRNCTAAASTFIQSILQHHGSTTNASKQQM